MKVKLSKEGATSYFGTLECLGHIFEARIVEEYFAISGTDLISAGGCATLLDIDSIYLFEASEVELL